MTVPQSSLPALKRLLSRSYLSVEEAAADVCREVRNALWTEVVFVTRVDGDDLEVLAVAGSGLAVYVGQRFPLAETPCARALRGEGPLTAGDLAESPYADLPVHLELGAGSYHMAPLLDAAGAPFGTLCALSRDPIDIGEEDRALLDLFAGLLAREQELDRVRSREAAAASALATRAAALAESEARFRALVDEMRDIIVRTGPDGTIEFVNRAWTELTGIGVAETLGRGAFDNVHPEDRAAAADHLRAVAVGEAETSREIRFLAGDGSLRWMEVKGRALFDEAGTLAGFSGMLNDVTVRRLAEDRVRTALTEAEQARDQAQQALAEAERASRAKSEFLSRMSHELRTPLNAILGFAQLLELAELGAEDAEGVALILRAGRHLLDLINEVLDVVRIESGRLSLSLEPVSVAEVVTESLDLVRTAAAARSLVIEAPAARDPNLVVGDRQRLKQVLVNLLSNAVKYNRDAGRVAVTCEALSVGPRGLPEAGHGWLRIAVTDTGRGIPADRLEDVFVPFERLGAENTEVEGTGVGLSLTRTLVEAQGGSIEVTSTPGVGSVFSLDLPAAGPVRWDPPGDPTAAGPPGSPSGELVRARVLYVEDNASNITLVRRVLARRPDVELLVATDGAVGLELARRELPDLVLLDLHLPGASGQDVLAGLRAETDPLLSTVPVVVLTADLTRSVEQQVRALGATEFLSKPIDVTRLLDVVDEHTPARS